MIRTGDLTNGSAVVTSVTTAGLLVGMEVVGTGVPSGTSILTIDSGSQLTMSQDATADGTEVTLEINTVFQGSGSASGVVDGALSMGLVLHGAGVGGGEGEGLLSLIVEMSAVGYVEAVAMATITEAPVVLYAEANASASDSVNISILHDLSGNAFVAVFSEAHVSSETILMSESSASARGVAYLSFVGQGLGVCDVINDILFLWGIEDARMSVEYLRERALHDLNAAMQLIWSQARDRDYFSRRTLTVGVAAGSGSVELEQEVQNVIGPVRRASDKGNLRPLASRSQLDLFGHLFLGETSIAVAQGTPLAFFAERLNQNRPDNTKIVLHVIPAPEESAEFLVDVAMECPRYEWSDYCQCTPLHIPHRYAESVLLPVCRHRAMSCHYFIKENLRELIEKEYQTAMMVLGVVDPQIKEAEASQEAA